MNKNSIKKLANGGMYLISRLIPRSKRNVVVGGWYGKRFADNSKAMFLYLNEHRKEFHLKHIYFFTRDKQIYSELYSKGYECLLPDGLVSAWWHLRAKYHIVDENGGDIKNLFSVRAKRVNLWHGFPLKKIGYLCDKNLHSYEEAVAYNNSIAKSIRGCWSDQYILNMSDEQEKRQAYAFGLPKEKLLRGVYPRDAYMKGLIEPFYLACERIPRDKIEAAREQGKKVIFYLPTFRDDVAGNNVCAQSVNQLAQSLDPLKYLIITKLHFAAKADVSIEERENVINLPSESDVYNFLRLSDLLITDYSSVYFDWLLLDKPLLFYPFDAQSYMTADRGFIDDYEAATPGAKAYNSQELLEQIGDIFADEQKYLAAYQDRKDALVQTVYGDSIPTQEGMKALWEEIKAR